MKKKMRLLGVLAIVLLAGLFKTAFFLAGCELYGERFCEHNWEWVVTITATAAQNGVETKTCSICKKTDGVRLIDILGNPIDTNGNETHESDCECETCKGEAYCEHVFADNGWTEKTSANCVASKVEKNPCTRAGCTHELTRNVGESLGGHDFVSGICTRAECFMIEMASISEGSFERNGHTITLSAFRMSKFQVTQELYEAVMGHNPSFFNSSPAAGEIQSKRPVESVGWYDAIVFCNRLSMREGLTPAYRINGSTDPADWGAVPTSINATWDAVEIVEDSTGYRLPTEAQWEYACRAGSTTLWHFGDEEDDLKDYAWYWYNSNSRTRQVGLKLPNAWGLYDMHGNVWEWCWDRWSGTFPNPADLDDPQGAASGFNRVIRGGSWINDAWFTQSAYRYFYFPFYWYDVIGFRLVRP